MESPDKSSERDKERFFALANQLSTSRDAAEQQRLKEELARTTFDE